MENIYKKLREVDQNNDNVIEFDEFLNVTSPLFLFSFHKVISKLREGRIGSDRGFGALYQKQANLVKVKGATDATTHSIDQDEHEQFCVHLNSVLSTDKAFDSRTPIQSTPFSELYEKCRDGLVLWFA